MPNKCVLSYSANVGSLVNWTFQSFGEENLSKFTIANISYLSESGIWLVKYWRMIFISPKVSPAKALCYMVMNVLGNDCFIRLYCISSNDCSIRLYWLNFLIKLTFSLMLSMTYYVCSAGIIGGYCTKMFAEQNPRYFILELWNWPAYHNW